MMSRAAPDKLAGIAKSPGVQGSDLAIRTEREGPNRAAPNKLAGDWQIPRRSTISIPGRPFLMLRA